MKKLLCFLFLSIFFCTNAFASSYNCKILGKQNIPSNQDFEYKSLIKLSKLALKIEENKLKGGTRTLEPSGKKKKRGFV